MTKSSLWIFGFLCAAPVPTWAGQKSIAVDRPLQREAVAIAKVLYRNTRLQCGMVVDGGVGVPAVVEPVAPFEAGDDWLDHVTVVLYNQTDKTIVATGIAIRFPETGSGTYGSPIAVAPISLGRIPDGLVLSAQTHKPMREDPRILPISFAPHQTLLIDLGSYIDQIRTGATSTGMPFSSLTRCILQTTYAFFDDRMKWDGGAYWVEDLDRPGKFKALDRRYFPGAKPPRRPLKIAEEKCPGSACGGDGCCENEDPIAIDVSGAGFLLSSKANGVMFDFFADGKPVQMAWTAGGSDTGWLVLDRDGNGRIGNGAGLFSNVSPQPDFGNNARLGFRSLAVYDDPASGGNDDGKISAADRVFSKLLVWVDKNHDGISQPEELLSMQQAKIESISIHYRYSNYTDQFGNQFRYRSAIAFTGAPQGAERYVYDVVLTAR